VALPGHHGWAHRPRWLGGADPDTPLGFYEIKVFADPNALDGNLPDEARIVVVGDGKFIFMVPHDLDQAELVHVAAFVTVAGSCTVQLRNVTQAYDFLSTKVTIDAAEFTSYTATTPPVIDDTKLVDKGDLIAIDVDAADGTCEGLGVVVQFAIR
jgi:hypothetical protein